MSRIKQIPPKGENTSLINRLPLVAGVMDNKDLSKNVSGQASRYLLAFFMPKFCLFSQNSKMDSISTPSPLHRAKTTFLKALMPISYGRVTLRNKPIGEYAGRLLTLPRVNPTTIYKVVISLTQKMLGGYHA